MIEMIEIGFFPQTFYIFFFPERLWGKNQILIISIIGENPAKGGKL